MKKSNSKRFWKECVNDTSSSRKNHEVQKSIIQTIEKDENNQVKYYDEKHISRIFNVEDKILLNFKNIHIFKSSKKLDHKYYESFEIEKFFEKQIYKLRLSHTFRIHNVFHVFLLKSYKKRFDDVTTSFSIMINEKKHDEIKLILNNKLYRKRLQYFVKWLSWSNIENQWIYAENVQIDELIQDFHQQYFNKLNTNASNAKLKRIEKNWFNQKKNFILIDTKSNYNWINYSSFFLKFNDKWNIFTNFWSMRWRRKFAIFFKRN
jgi:hypothetical protein